MLELHDGSATCACSLPATDNHYRISPGARRGSRGSLGDVMMLSRLMITDHSDGHRSGTCSLSRLAAVSIAYRSVLLRPQDPPTTFIMRPKVSLPTGICAKRTASVVDEDAKVFVGSFRQTFALNKLMTRAALQNRGFRHLARRIMSFAITKIPSLSGPMREKQRCEASDLKDDMTVLKEWEKKGSCSPQLGIQCSRHLDP